MQLNLLTACAQVGQNGINAILVDGAERRIGETQGDKAVFAFYPQTTVLQIRQKPTLGSVICVGNVVPGHGFFTRYLTYASHDAPQVNFEEPTLYHGILSSGKPYNKPVSANDTPPTPATTK